MKPAARVLAIIALFFVMVGFGVCGFRGISTGLSALGDDFFFGAIFIMPSAVAVLLAWLSLRGIINLMRGRDLIQRRKTPR